jgi:hypothetical protein
MTRLPMDRIVLFMQSLDTTSTARSHESTLDSACQLHSRRVRARMFSGHVG